MLPTSSPLAGARFHAASRPTASETVSAAPSRQSTTLPESKSTSVAPLEVKINPRKAWVPLPSFSRAQRLSHARNATTAVTVNQPSIGRDRSSALTAGPSISPRLKVNRRKRPETRTQGAKVRTASATANTVAARASQGMRSVTSTGGNAGRATAV